MANLKEIRTRIASVKSTRQITSAMKMVSAAKLRKAQDAIIQLRPYANKLTEILGHLTQSLEDSIDNKYGIEREVNKVLIVVLASNKGLCGAFNSNIVKHVVQLVENDYQVPFKRGDIDILALGKKGSELLKTKGLKPSFTEIDLIDAPKFEEAVALAESIMVSYTEKKYDKVILVYNQFKNAAVQVLTEEQFLPVAKPEEDTETFESTHLDYILEPSKKEIVNDLIPKSLKTQFFKAILDSVASEHGARMTAMHKATDNASDLINALQLDYNKARQAAITTEILEIVGGAEALKG